MFALGRADQIALKVVALREQDLEDLELLAHGLLPGDKQICWGLLSACRLYGLIGREDSLLHGGTRMGTRRIRPQASHLSSPGHQLLMTRWGPLDLLGVIGAGLGYDDLLSQTEEMEIEPRAKVRVLNLETLIKIKEELGHEKDKAVLAVLRRTLEAAKG